MIRKSELTVFDEWQKAMDYIRASKCPIVRSLEIKAPKYSSVDWWWIVEEQYDWVSINVDAMEDEDKDLRYWILNNLGGRTEIF